jgi:FkbM family methyltransferase
MKALPARLGWQRTGIVVGFRIRRYARERRRSRVVRRIARQCEKFLFGYFNEAFFDLDRNGEGALIAALVDEQPGAPILAFDVGAHRGEWTKAVVGRNPDAVVYCFEIVPALARELRDHLAGLPNVHVCEHGLSSTSRQLHVHWNKTFETTSSVNRARHEGGFMIGSDVVRVNGEVKTGDMVLESLSGPRIDLLKMDVEGHEIEVLYGFRRTLESAARRPRIIQFEYADTWLPEPHTLREAYMLLEPCGYAIGRLYPDGVDFKPYEFKDDHFRTGNYVAIAADDPLKEKIIHFGHVGAR